MRPLLLPPLLLLLTLLARPTPAAAQTAPAAPASAPAATDLILRTDGQEVAGRVLLVTPTELRYLPAPGAGAGAAPAPTADTLRLPVAEVFLVRYANGTREVLSQPASATQPAEPGVGVGVGLGRLAGLPGAERQRLGRADARQFYRGRKVFWGAAGAAFVPYLLGPVLGLGSTALIASKPVADRNLAAPVPALLQDPDYNLAYRDQAHKIKRGKAWAGYGTGVGAQVLLVAVAFAGLVYGFSN